MRAQIGRGGGEAAPVEKWPFVRKLQLLLLAVIVMMIADALTSWALIAFGAKIQLPFSVESGFMAFIGIMPFLWYARPRERRHLFNLCAGTFVATAAALVVTTLVTHRLSPDTITFQQRKLFAISTITAVCAWGLVYLLREIWEEILRLPSNDDAEFRENPDGDREEE